MGCSPGKEAVVFSPRRHQGKALKEGRLSGGKHAHFMGKIKGRRAQCKLCMFDCVSGCKAYKSMSPYFCKQCGDHLHFECFEEYHTKENPRSQFEE